MSQPSSNMTDMLASVLEQNQTMTDMIVQLSSENLAQHFKLNRLMDDMNDLRSELRAVSSILGVNAVRRSASREADNAGNIEAGNAQPGAVARRVTEGDDTGAGQAVQQAATGAVRAKRSRQDVAPAAPPNGTFEASPSTSKKARKDPNLDPDPEPQTRDDASRHQQDTSGSAAAGSSLKYKAGDVVLAKVKGYPEWPGMVRIYTPFSSGGSTAIAEVPAPGTLRRTGNGLVAGKKVMDSSAAPAAVTAVQGSRPYLIRFFPDGDL